MSVNKGDRRSDHDSLGSNSIPMNWRHFDMSSARERELVGERVWAPVSTYTFPTITEESPADCRNVLFVALWTMQLCTPKR